jgi:hypothetical protein
VADPARSDREVTFRSGEVVSHLDAAISAALDVRDKGELAALRASRHRDILLWRVTLGCAAALGLFALGELALIGGHEWQKVRDKKFRAQKPTVEKIMTSDALARRIDDLATKRLLPWEMMALISGGKDSLRPEGIWFGRVYTTPTAGIYTLSIDAQTNSVGTISAYTSKLKTLPIIENVETRGIQAKGDSATFTLVVTFKPDSIKPGALL